MKKGLPEITARYAGKRVGQLAIAAGVTEAAGFLGNAFYYAGTEPTNGSQTMIAHIGTGMANYNPFGENENGWAIAKDNAFGGLIVGGLILACYAGSKVWSWFSGVQSQGWKGAQESYNQVQQKRARKKAKLAKDLSRAVEDLQEEQ